MRSASQPIAHCCGNDSACSHTPSPKPRAWRSRRRSAAALAASRVEVGRLQQRRQVRPQRHVEQHGAHRRLGIEQRRDQAVAAAGGLDHAARMRGERSRPRRPQGLQQLRCLLRRQPRFRRVQVRPRLGQRPQRQRFAQPLQLRPAFQQAAEQGRAAVADVEDRIGRYCGLRQQRLQRQPAAIGTSRQGAFVEERRRRVAALR